MNPFHEKIAYTILAAVLYSLPFLVPALKDAHLLNQLGVGIAAAMWWSSPTERAMKKKLREHRLSDEG